MFIDNGIDENYDDSEEIAVSCSTKNQLFLRNLWIFALETKVEDQLFLTKPSSSILFSTFCSIFKKNFLFWQPNTTRQIKINLHIYLIKKFEYFFNFSAIKWVNRNFFTESHTCPCIIRHVNVQNLLHTVCFDGWRQNLLKRQMCMFTLAKICLLSRHLQRQASEHKLLCYNERCLTLLTGRCLKDFLISFKGTWLSAEPIE